MNNDYITSETKKIAKEEGRQLERYRIAQNLLYMGFDFEIIYFTTNLSKEDFIKIKDEYRKIKSNLNTHVTVLQIQKGINEHANR